MLMLVFEGWKDGRNETDELAQHYDGGTDALQQSRSFSQYDKPTDENQNRGYSESKTNGRCMFRIHYA